MSAKRRTKRQGSAHSAPSVSANADRTVEQLHTNFSFNDIVELRDMGAFGDRQCGGDPRAVGTPTLLCANPPRGPYTPPPTPQKTREKANHTERKRVEKINAGFEALKAKLPDEPQLEKSSKAMLLESAVEHLARLQAQVRALQEENAELRSIIAANKDIEMQPVDVDLAFLLQPESPPPKRPCTALGLSVSTTLPFHGMHPGATDLQSIASPVAIGVAANPSSGTLMPIPCNGWMYPGFDGQQQQQLAVFSQSSAVPVLEASLAAGQGCVWSRMALLSSGGDQFSAASHLPSVQRGSPLVNLASSPRATVSLRRGPSAPPTLGYADMSCEGLGVDHLQFT